MPFFLQLYATACTIRIPLLDPTTGNYITSYPTFETNDLMISKDGATLTNKSDATLILAKTRGNVELTFNIADLTAKNIEVSIIDQTATKVFRDTELIIRTYGHANSYYPHINSSDVNANIVKVNGVAVSSINDFKTDISSLATTSNLAAAKVVIDSIYALLGSSILIDGSTTIAQAIEKLAGTGFVSAADSLQQISNTKLSTGTVDGSSTVFGILAKIAGVSFASGTDSLNAIRIITSAIQSKLPLTSQNMAGATDLSNVYNNTTNCTYLPTRINIGSCTINKGTGTAGNYINLQNDDGSTQVITSTLIDGFEVTYTANLVNAKRYVGRVVIAGFYYSPNPLAYCSVLALNQNTGLYEEIGKLPVESSKKQYSFTLPFYYSNITSTAMFYLKFISSESGVANNVTFDMITCGAISITNIDSGNSLIQTQINTILANIPKKSVITTLPIIISGTGTPSEYTRLAVEDGSSMIITSTNLAALDIQFEISCESGRLGTKLNISGFYSGSGSKQATFISVYNWDKLTWDVVSPMNDRMFSSLVIQHYYFILNNSHTSPAGLIRFKATASETGVSNYLSLDYISASHVDLSWNTFFETNKGVWGFDITKQIDYNTPASLIRTLMTSQGTISSIFDSTHITVQGGSYVTNGFQGLTIVYGKRNTNKVYASIVESNDASGNIVLRKAFAELPEIDDLFSILPETASMTFNSDGVVLSATQGLYAPSKAGDAMNLTTGSITFGKYDNSSAFPVESPDTLNSLTRIARIGSTTNYTVKSLVDLLAILQSSIDNIQNITKFMVSLPSFFIIPETGYEAFIILVLFFDENGLPKDPDANKIGIQITDISGTIKSNLYKDYLCTLSADNYSPILDYKQMERISVGRYKIYYNLPYNEVEDQWSLNFQALESTVSVSTDKTINVINAILSEVTLKDENQNYLVMQKAIKNITAGSIPSNIGSIYYDLVLYLQGIDTKESSILTEVNSPTHGLAKIETDLTSTGITVTSTKAELDIVKSTTDNIKSTTDNIRIDTISILNKIGTITNLVTGATIGQNLLDVYNKSVEIKNLLASPLLANLIQVKGDEELVNKFSKSLVNIEYRTIVTSSSNTFTFNVINTIILSSQAYIGRAVYFKGNNIEGIVRTIIAIEELDPDTFKITFDGAALTPDPNSTFVIV